MSAEKKHDYHLVDPSPWPIYVSFSCLVLAIGTIYYMHNDISWGMYLGLALLFYGAYMWFRDVVIEAEHQGHHTPVVQIHHRYGMTLFIASEVMFFVAWFWAYFDISLFPNEFVGNVWPPKDIETFDPWDIPFINTLILLVGFTFTSTRNNSGSALIKAITFCSMVRICDSVFIGYKRRRERLSFPSIIYFQCKCKENHCYHPKTNSQIFYG